MEDFRELADPRIATVQLPRIRATLRDGKTVQFGRIAAGMNVVDGINPEYGETPDQGAIQAQGNAYLTKNFPRMDFVRKATIEP